MEKKILIFNLAIYFIAFCVGVADSVMSLHFQPFFIALFCLLTLFFINWAFRPDRKKKAYLALSVINLLQSFSFIIFGLTYKVIIGPDLSFYLINSSDVLARFSFKVFNMFSYFNFIGNDNTVGFVGLGINFMHLFTCVYFYVVYKRTRA